MSLLEIQDLHVEFRTRHTRVRAVERLSFAIEPGEIVGLVGESGSGKSVTSLAILGLLESPAGRVTQGSLRFAGKELRGLGSDELRKLRGNRIAMIFQDPSTSLNPYLTIEEQLCEVGELHLGLTRHAARSRAVELLARVGISDPTERIRSYPHQLSGGMRQRVCIAMALLCDPALLIADEPTTMLDVSIQAQILQILREIRQERQMSILFITHDLGVVAELCDRVLVMYAGRLVEQAKAAELFARPLHPYTEALLRSTPRVDEPRGGAPQAIPGMPPRLEGGALQECAFAERCSRVRDECRAREPELSSAGDGRLRRCIVPVEEM